MLNISLIQIHYLIALNEHRNFIKAADACFVTQPTLSMQIKKLEDELGVILFDRSRQPIIPTEIGEKIIQQAKIIAKETNLINMILEEHTGNFARKLSIGIIPTIAAALIPKLIHQISQHHPDIKLEIREMLTSDIVEALQEDKLDVGIVSTPIADQSLIEEPLYIEKFRIYLHPDHPSYAKKTLDSADLLEDKIWLLTEGNCFRTQSLNLCNIPDTQLNHLALNYESGSLSTLKKIVDVEGGCTILPEWEAGELDDNSLNNLRAFKEDGAGREVGLIYTKYYAKTQVIQRLKSMIMASLPNHVAENKNLERILF